MGDFITLEEITAAIDAGLEPLRESLKRVKDSVERIENSMKRNCRDNLEFNINAEENSKIRPNQLGLPSDFPSANSTIFFESKSAGNEIMLSRTASV